MILFYRFKVILIFIVIRRGIKFAFSEQLKQEQFSKDYFVVTYDPYTNPDLIGNRYAYNVTDQIPFLELVSSKFTTILVNTTYEDMHDKNTSLALAPSSTALLNLKHSRIKLEVWLSVQRNISEGYPNGYLSEQCEHLVVVADRANNIFPGTVTTLVFRYDYCWFNRRFIHDDDLKNCRTSILNQSSHKYRILIFLDSLNCDEIKDCILERNPVFTQADVILFKEIPSIHLTESGVDAFFPKFQTKLEKCKRYITSAVNRPSVQVGVISTWLANTENYYSKNEQWYELTQYWQKLNNWAVATETPVVLMKAFDTPYETNISLQTTGWWRLENSQYNSSTEYKFEDKYQICCNQVNLSSDGNELTALTTWLKNISVKTFDNSSVGVWFDPFVKPEKNAKYDESDVNAMVRVITSKFSKFLIRPLFESYYNNDTTVSLIPNALTIECKKNPSKTFEVTMYLITAVSLDVHKRQHSFHETILIADQLNTNCPGIVKTFVLPYLLGPYEWSVEYIKNNLTYASESMSSYKLGVQLPISWCEQDFLATFNTVKRPTDLLKMVDIIYLIVEPSENSDNMKVDRLIWQVTHKFTKCKKKVGEDLGLDSDKSFVPLVMMTYFRPKPGIYNDLNSLVDFLKFWEGITEWAKISNNLVVLFEAIDNPGKSELRERGWWRLNVNLSENSNHKLEPRFFEEKATVALKLATQKKISQNVEQSTSLFSKWEFVLTIITVPVILSILFITVAVYFIRRYRQQYLSNSEILDFFQGTSRQNDEINIKTDGITEVSYNKKIYELSSYSFSLGSVIGQGNFGIVHKSTVNGETAVIKIPRNGCSKEAFKSTLNEIKVLSYVGNHANVVRFLGAFTKSIRKGKVCIAMEYCSGGSLQSYLRSKSVAKFEISIYELCKFCWEIASGMEYIAGRKIVHGDLSTRNVLLTDDLTCKIGDFGLSRKLYEYGIYIKTNNQEPLPWRWLALESLKRMEFTTMTDIWSFGVTVWEIFSIGDVPYPGMVWSSNFVNEIESGVRMGSPTYSSSMINQKMLDCWNADPNLRPSFSTLGQFFVTAMQDDYENM